MKPHEVVAILVANAGGAKRVADEMLRLRLTDKNLQSHVHKFAAGDVQVRGPAHSTAMPLATYLEIPLNAIYDEKAATAVAVERKLTALPVPDVKPRKRKPQRLKDLIDRLMAIDDDGKREKALDGWEAALTVTTPGSQGRDLSPSALELAEEFDQAFATAAAQKINKKAVENTILYGLSKIRRGEPPAWLQKDLGGQPPKQVRKKDQQTPPAKHPAEPSARNSHRQK